MKKKWMALLAAGIMTLCMCVPVLATEIEVDSAGNVMAAGDLVTLPATPFFGAIAAGQSVSVINNEAKGSVMAAGQTVDISGSKIGESLYMAGNSVSMKDTKVSGNIYAAGNSVTITGDSEGNGVYFAGNMLSFEGVANGVFAGGSHVVLNGTINGDAVIEEDSVEVMDGTIITGDLTISSPSEPSVSDGAQVGNYTFNKVTKTEHEAGKAMKKASIGAKFVKKLSSCIYWIAAMAAFGMLLCWLFNDHLAKAAIYMKTRTGAMIGSGVIGWMCIPVAAILLCCTFVLAPVGLMLGMAYALFLCAGLAFTGASLVRLFLPRMNIFLSALIGIAVLEVVRLIPVIGFTVGVAADMYLLAYVIQTLWLRRLRKYPAQTQAGQNDGEA